MNIARSGTYLGFTIGPEKHEGSWSKAAHKYEKRVNMWETEPLGLQYSALVYNTFAMSTLGYVSQLEDPPSWLLSQEEAMLRKVAKGPGKWAMPADLWRLQESFGLARSFTSLQHMSRAAQFRARALDPACRPSKEFRQRVLRLRRLIDNPLQFAPLAAWSDWFARSFMLKLQANYDDITDNVCTKQELERDILQQHPANNKNGQEQIIRTNIQRAAYRTLLQYQAPCPLNRVREKLVRWRLHKPEYHTHGAFNIKRCLPAWTSQTCHGNLCRLQHLVPPRVVSAAFSTIFNRWQTHRRFQERELPSNWCMLKCHEIPTDMTEHSSYMRHPEDSLEHYANCACVRKVATRFLRLHPSQVNLHAFMLCSPTVINDDDLAATSLLIYATYRATNQQRHGHALPSRDVYDAMCQLVREGAKGHAKAMTTVQSRWLPRVPDGNTLEGCQRRTRRRIA